ncbi:MAG TPA: PP2C family protein-serine/threonine phosphatase [Thermoanaerobaculia bacterium]|nr:PP2C family protein-serine/threonine phosphatase [Thermoanaerobaculia bacterium]
MLRNKGQDLLVWGLLGAAGLALLVWAFPRIYPFYPPSWTVNKAEATAIALERMRDLGPPVEDPLVVTTLEGFSTLEERLHRALPAAGLERLRGDMLARETLRWHVRVYPPRARPGQFTYRVIVSPRGEVVDLLQRVPPEEEGGVVDSADARRRADTLLAAQGFDLADFAEPVLRRTEQRARTDLAVRYRHRDAALGEIPYGVEVLFAGEQLAGFASFVDDPEANELQARLQPIALMSQFRMMVPVLLFPLVGFYFLRRYHAGEVGVRRSVEIFVLAYGAGILLMLITGATSSEGNSFGLLSRRQVAWAFPVQLVVLWFPLMALVAALSWSVGEAASRERWGRKLAAFDALFQRQWGNATVAASALRGVAAGLALAGGLHLLLWLLPDSFAAPRLTVTLGPWWESAGWAGLALLAFTLCYTLFTELLARLFLLSASVKRIGRWGAGLLVTVLSALLFWPMVSGSTVAGSLLLGFLGAAGLVALFLAYDLLTALLAALMGGVVTQALPFLLADDPFLRFQGALPLLIIALPMLVSLRALAGGREFVYRWEDVPPHVRRIAERERQSVELETARRIQSSILPELPAQLNGVQVAHSYLPASEVGGDFYDVLALEDGRLALAVGDVAGHGVSSGLVMSMAKSALAVQVTFDPDVGQVFRTLNRTVFQTARKRLLATLCYAILDPVRRELLYASAGHLFPYRIGRDGRVEALESVSYPLGVRDVIDVLPKEAHLDAGDTLFLFSDGIVEAHPEDSEEPFGFDRLEAVLAANAHEPVSRLRDAVLAAVERHTGDIPREDDQTVLVLRLP